MEVNKIDWLIDEEGEMVLFGNDNALRHERLRADIGAKQMPLLLILVPMSLGKLAKTGLKRQHCVTLLNVY